jgi:tetratricopeptide (TPR) repeat protein
MRSRDAGRHDAYDAFSPSLLYSLLAKEVFEMPGGDAEQTRIDQETATRLEGTLNEIRARLEADSKLQAQALAALEDRIKLKDELATFRESMNTKFERVNAKFLFLQWTAAAVAVVASILGTLGLKSANDYISATKNEMLQRLDHVSSYYYDFSRGVALGSSGQWKEALPHLRRCFDQDHYDEGLLVPYLEALDEADDWEQAADIIGTLRDQPKRYLAIKSPWVWSGLANLQIQMGVEKEAFSSEGRECLTRFERLADPEDPDMLRALYIQHWMLALRNRNVLEARAYIDKISALPPSVKVDSWATVRNWRFTKTLLSKGKISGKDMEAMYNALKIRFKADSV